MSGLNAYRKSNLRPDSINNSGTMSFSPGINGEGELRGQLANPGSPGKMAIKTECMCVIQ